MTQKKYDDEFKRNAVDLLLTSGKPLKPMARELGVSDSALRDWRDKHLERLEDAIAVFRGDNGEHLRDRIGPPSGFPVSLCPCVCPVSRPRFRRVASGHGEGRQAGKRPEQAIKKGVSVSENPSKLVAGLGFEPRTFRL